MMVPWHDRNGNLELLIRDAIQEAAPHLTPFIEDFCRGCHADERPEDLLAKMHVRLQIAALNPTNPSLALTYYLHKPIEICPIDYQHRAFDQIAGFLAQFAQVAAP